MELPQPPNLQKLDHISPTLYEAARVCLARAAWIAHGDRKAVPDHPRALLGTGLHAVLEEARRGRLSSKEPQERRERARRYFDRKIEELFVGAHPLLGAKFLAAERLPFYNLFRERSALVAAEVSAGWHPERLEEEGEKDKREQPTLLETRLQSKDGRVVGRPDVLDRAESAVLDYKTGVAPGAVQVSDSEARQLRLYAYLARQNDVCVDKGIVLRPDRTRAQIEISEEEANEEGRRATAMLEEYNRRAGRSFQEVSTPTPQGCRFCPCIPFCDGFWDAAESAWATDCGVHVEGEVVAVQGEQLMSVEMKVARGSAPEGRSVLTRLSERWVTIGGAERPAPGDTLRAVNLLYLEESSDPVILRADRLSTAVWQLQPTTHRGTGEHA